MKREKISREKIELTQGHRLKNDPQPLFNKSPSRDETDNTNMDTPFHPRTEEHTALLDKARTGEQVARLLLHLQRSYGNAYVQRLVRNSNIQTKLNVSSPGDKQEIEAEQVAKRIVSMSRAPAGIQLLHEHSDSNSSVNSGLESRLSGNQGRGTPLPDDVRAYMEPRFGVDFGSVRLHTDAEATQMSHELNAQAFTLGQDIYFGEGKYNPAAQSGKHLLAHELTHVVQQGGAIKEADRTPAFGQSQDRSEIKEESRLAEDGDTGADTAPDYDAPIDTQVDIILEEHTSGGNGRSGISRQETAVIQRDDTVTFPSWATIASDSTITSETESAWQETLDATTETTRREQSFWIRWNSQSSAFSISQKRTGPLVTDAQTASVSPGAKPPDSGDEYTVGLFHTHTPTRYRTYGRGVGPSGVDITYHDNNDIPGLVYDYVEDKGGTIPAKHPLNAGAQVYDCGPDQRTPD